MIMLFILIGKSIGTFSDEKLNINFVSKIKLKLMPTMTKRQNTYFVNQNQISVSSQYKIIYSCLSRQFGLFAYIFSIGVC